MNKRHAYKRQIKAKKLEEAFHDCEIEICSLFTDDDQDSIKSSLSVANITQDIPPFSIINNSSEFRKVTFMSLFPYHKSIEIDWTSIPSCLDPAAGELNPTRSSRKQNQVSSLILAIEEELHFKQTLDNTSDKESQSYIVDFGSGSGHLALLLAYRNPSIHIILVEKKEYSVEVARKRIDECHLSNVFIYCGDVRHIYESYPGLNINIGISLHSCGLLTDYAVDMCISHQASFVFSPCCYGQISKPPPDEIFSLLQMESSSRNRILSSLRDIDVLDVISSSADYVVGSDENYSSNVGFLLAKRAMRMIDFDRLLRCLSMNKEDDNIVRSQGQYYCSMKSLQPLSCSPKNNIIIGRYIPNTDI